jgi:EAL domain-containing protein (putative c-di-GMP-specific phosphodiesterase class I)
LTERDHGKKADGAASGDTESAVRLQTARPARALHPGDGRGPDPRGSGTALDGGSRRDRPTMEMPAAPTSNRLSDAPSAPRTADRSEPADNRFFDEVKPSDLSAVFQPIVTLATGEVFAYEALVRCGVPRFSSPPVLFEHAGASRATGRLGRMIREIAVPLCGGKPLFVNLHPNELEEGWLVRPDDPIFSHDHDIYLEITESAPITHFDLCTSVLREVCSRASAYLVVDDLGAGYSNLKIIADLEPKVVKLDRQLVQDLDSKPRQQKLVSFTVNLCNQLGAAVVAEGIETLEELKAVVDCGAQYGQGYLLARPGFPIPTITWPGEQQTPPQVRRR